MQFNITRNNGPARIGELKIDNHKVTTPNILFLDSNRFELPDFAKIILKKNKINSTKPEIAVPDYFVYPKDLSEKLHLSVLNLNKKVSDAYVIAGLIDIIGDAVKDNPSTFFIVENAYQLFQQPKKFTEYVVKLREEIGYQKMMYLPATGNPASFALLAYMDIDFFDNIPAILAARNGKLLFPTGSISKEDLIELPCCCQTCKKFENNPSDMDFRDILTHNYQMILNEMKNIRNAIYNKNLRSLVETRVKSDPRLTSILRNLDNLSYEFLEKRTPITSKNKLIATSKESLFRPEIKRFQERVMGRYKKPSSAEILLLLPCSAKKPYSFSKSHRLYRDRLLASSNPFAVHEVIITSPMGIVPRELELIYPASSYDIPVTGIWDEYEKKMIRTLLGKYLDGNHYKKIITHLPKGILDFTSDLLKNQVITCENSPTSKKSLDSLSKSLNNLESSVEKVSQNKRKLEDIKNIAAYQFGKDASEELLKN
ncbi:MAG: DUF5591 domain-containing protein, partial [Candidatus Thermoplasmatota archaeon]|nr:DUF5591 domain-containing protein [Candidatus Thermoplasmatota archaeon]